MNNPNNLEIERAVLGACMFGNHQVIEKVGAIVSPESFYHPDHRKVFAAIIHLANQGRPVDTLTVCDQIGPMKDGAYMVASIAGESATDANAEYHAQIIQDLYARRCIILRAQALAGRAEDESEELPSILSDAEGVCKDLSSGQLEAWVDIEQSIEEALAEAQRCLL